MYTNIHNIFVKRPLFNTESKEASTNTSINDQKSSVHSMESPKNQIDYIKGLESADPESSKPNLPPDLGMPGFGLSLTFTETMTIPTQQSGPESMVTSTPENDTLPTELESSATVEAESSTTSELESSASVGTEPENNTAPPEGSNTLGGVDE